MCVINPPAARRIEFHIQKVYVQANWIIRKLEGTTKD
jgi:hypothetical protein